MVIDENRELEDRKQNFNNLMQLCGALPQKNRTVVLSYKIFGQGFRFSLIRLYTVTSAHKSFIQSQKSIESVDNDW